MASFELIKHLDQLKACIEHRKQLFDSGSFSVPETEGYPVIFTSGTTKEEKFVLAEHAEALANDSRRSFFGAIIIHQAQVEDIVGFLNDPENTSIALIGDGNFSTMHLTLPEGSGISRITWRSLAKAAPHLKTGVVEQRTCTRLVKPTEEARVALPSFIVADQTKIISSIGKSFATHHGYDVFNRFIHPVYDESHNNADQLRRPFGINLETGNIPQQIPNIHNSTQDAML